MKTEDVYYINQKMSYEKYFELLEKLYPEKSTVEADKEFRNENLVVFKDEFVIINILK